MTPNQRIALNIVATYGRSLFALVCGLLTGRWLLQVLGTVDYGLYGVVGGLTAFIAFFNGILASAVGRFYAFSVGAAQIAGREAEGLETCRQWFNTAVLLHTVVPVALMLIGYPLGAYAVRNWLTIPADRVEACVWVFRFVCATCFVGMVNVPFNAMYVAKQRIAELTVYSVVQTCCNVVMLYYMVAHPAVWLTKYAAGMCVITCTPQLVIVLRALKVFPECQFVRRYFWDFSRLPKLGGFAGWQLFGNLGYLMKAQGVAILVNKLFGPTMNASLAVGTTVSAQTDQLAAAMNGAFSPAITNLAGAGEKARMLSMTYRSCKLGAVLSLFFILPLSLEIHAVLDLWLKTPPPQAAEVCLLMLATIAVDETARGVGIAVTAYGRIALYYVLLGGLNILSLPLAWAGVVWGWSDFLMILAVLLAVRVVAVVASARIAQHVTGLSFRTWFRDVFCKVLLVSACALAVGAGVKFLLRDYHWLRMLPTFAAVTLTFVPLAWCLVLAREERAKVAEKVRSKFGRLPGGRA